MADAEDEAVEEAAADKADAGEAGDTDKPRIGSPREAAVADEDAAEDADGTATTD